MKGGEVSAPRDLHLVQDPSGRTEAYYCRCAPVVIVDAEVLAWLKERLDGGSGSTVRICLHSGPEATLHDMVVVHRRGGEFKLHKHLTCEETYHMIEGRMRVDLFDDEGRKTGSYLIGESGSGLPLMCRVRSNVWHVNVPETEYAIFHESRPGPLDRSDSVTPDWA